MRKLLFTPCTNKAHFAMWVEKFLNIRLPDCTVVEESNSNPLDAAWEYYDRMVRNDLIGLSRVMSYAGRGGFKCQVKGTKVMHQTKGLLSIEDVVVGDVLWSGRSFRSVTAHIHDGVKESVKLTLEDGSTAEGSPIHRYWTWSPGSVPDWKRSDELTTDDFVMLDTSHGFQTQGELNQEEFDIGYLCGILQGDGGLSLMDSGRVTLTGMPGPAVDFFLDFCKKNDYHIYANKRFPHSKAHSYNVNSKNRLASYLKSLGLKPSLSFQKEIPSVVWKSRSCMAGFVSGLFDTDGCVVKDTQKVLFQLTATKMMSELQVLLRALGVDSQLTHLKLGKANKHPVSIVSVGLWQVPKLIKAGVRLPFGNKVNGVDHNRKPLNKNVNDCLSLVVLEPLLKKLPTSGIQNKQKSFKPRIRSQYPTVSRQKCIDLVTYGEINGHLTEPEVLFWRDVFKNKWSRVRQTERSVADFYDLTVENDHSYWSNGLVSHNTLSAAVLETVVVLHTPRNISHMAAIEKQSIKSAIYVKEFFQLPFLSDFVLGDNARKIQVVRYINKFTGTILNEKEFVEIPSAEQGKYERRANYIEVVNCTMAAANGPHSEFFVVDEIDVIQKQNIPAYYQSQNIPDPRDGMLPLTLLTSTRKSRIGLVQKEIDAQETSGLKVVHWNLMDITARCEPERHLPDLPQVTYYVNDDTLKHIPEDEFQVLNPGQQKKFVPVRGFEGCRSCRLFSACKGRLATHQTSTSPMLKPISFSLQKFQSAPTPEFIQTEYLCRKPDTSGLVYPRLNPERHMKTAQEIGEMITGLPQSQDLSKVGLLTLLKERGAKFAAGMDFGFSHNFATTTIAIYGPHVFVLDCYAQAGLELEEQIVNSQFLKDVYVNPPVWADPAYPGSIKAFSRRGFKMKEWSKHPHSVKAGIEIVRGLLWSGKGSTRLYFLKGDSGVELLFKFMGVYSFVVNAQGEPTEEPKKVDDDELDSMRYVLMNALGSQEALKDTTHSTELNKSDTIERGNPMKNIIQQHLGEETASPNVVPTTRVRRGRFNFDG